MDSLAQEFNLQIKDKKRVENVVADHPSRLAIAHNSHSLPINDDFPEESLMLMEIAPWYAHIANYLVLEKFQTSQTKERSKEEKQRKEAVLIVVHCHFGRLYFVHRAKSPFKNPIFGTGLELLTNQVPIVVYCHSYKELKMANFALCTVHAKMPCNQTTSKDVFPEDERLNLWFLGVKKAR
ncbi:hypothetical protein AAG906_000850 [Vitis piasezkii]